MTTQIVSSVLLKITVAFAVLAFTISLGMGLVYGIAVSVSLYRSMIAAGIFAAFGGFLSVILFLFFVED